MFNPSDFSNSIIASMYLIVPVAFSLLMISPVIFFVLKIVRVLIFGTSYKPQVYNAAKKYYKDNY
ncbi:MAG TPA: hypothetical protein DCS12_09835 [Clostridiales bacterium]|nr:hypothetical protein [Clostridiales bacterium]